MTTTPVLCSQAPSVAPYGGKKNTLPMDLFDNMTDEERTRAIEQARRLKASLERIASKKGN